MDLLKKTLVVSAIILLPTLSHAQIIDLNAGGVVSDMPASKSEMGTSWSGDINLKSVQESWDKFKPEDSVATFKWSKYKTFKTRLRVNMNTLIVLPEDDEISAFSLGNDESFNVLLLPKQKNMLNVKAFNSGIDTDLKIIGKSGRIYNFYLRCDPINTSQPPTLTVYVRTGGGDTSHFQYATLADKKSLSKKAREREEDIEAGELIKNGRTLPQHKNDYLKTLADPKNANVNYKMWGDMEISPFATYDDGNWTYFDFRGGLASDRLPVAYKVVDGYESVVNTRMENGFLIAESISPEGWTLRNGEMYVCVKAKDDLRKQYQERNKRLSSTKEDK
jgi:ComB9 competence protein